MKGQIWKHVNYHIKIHCILTFTDLKLCRYMYKGDSENTDQCSSMSAVGQVSSFECVVYLFTPAPIIMSAVLRSIREETRRGRELSGCFEVFT